MKKVPFAIMEPHVDKLYQGWFAEKDLAELDRHILFIKEFLHACGYTTEEYIRELMNFNQGN